MIRGEAFIAANEVIEEALDNVEKDAWEKETLKNIPEFNVIKLVQTVSEVAHFQQTFHDFKDDDIYMQQDNDEPVSFLNWTNFYSVTAESRLSLDWAFGVTPTPYNKNGCNERQSQEVKELEKNEIDVKEILKLET